MGGGAIYRKCRRSVGYGLRLRRGKKEGWAKGSGLFQKCRRGVGSVPRKKRRMGKWG